MTLLSQRRLPNAALMVALLTSCATYAAQAPAQAYRQDPEWAHPPAGFVWGEIVSIDLDAKGNVYVLQRCSTNTCVGRSEPPILKFSPRGRHLSSWGSGLLVWPHGMNIDRQGNLWIADGRADSGRGQQVLKLNPKGEVIMRIGTAGVTGLGPYTFDGVSDVVVAANGDFFVADGHGNRRIVKYTADGKYVKEWGKAGSGDGEFNEPHAIAVDSKGRVLVADRGNGRVQAFDQDGNFLQAWPAFGRASSIAVDANDNVYTSSQNGRANPGLVRGLFKGREGVAAPVVPNFNAESIAVDRDGNLYSGERPMGDVVAPDKLHRFRPESLRLKQWERPMNQQSLVTRDGSTPP